MIPVRFDEANCIMTKPENMTDEQCSPLQAYKGKTNPDNLPVIISCWQADEKELEEFKKTGKLWLYVYGVTMQPVSLITQCPFQKVEETTMSEEQTTSKKISKVFAKEAEENGVWLSTGKGPIPDVHFYIKNGNLIFGRNSESYSKDKASTTALCFKDNEVVLQFVENGEVKFVNINPDDIREDLTEFLKDITEKYGSKVQSIAEQN